MEKTFNWLYKDKNGKRKRGKVTMNICERCGIGVGVTDYPDMQFEHVYKELINGMCLGCFREVSGSAN
ncbi:MAG: hypothetical protein FJ044_03490 [Candidatus Cloacimonetes bacterium]|nr:hypothetical protein [Candidatus Cloacimonadota bacterium]